jgi:hypothetical protein
MKSIRKLFVLTTILLLTFSNTVKIEGQEKLYRNKYRTASATGTTPTTGTTHTTATTPANSATIGTTPSNTTPTADPMSLATKEANYMDLVTNPIKPKCKVLLDPRLLFGSNIEDFPQRGPYPRPNPFKIANVEDTSFINYVFDYLQEMTIKKENNVKLSEMITKGFTEAFEEAKKLPKKDSQFSNPYTAPKLLFYYSKGAAGEQPFTDPRLIDLRSINNRDQALISGMVPPLPADSKNITPDDVDAPQVIFDTIKSYNKNFDKDLWSSGLTPIQILHVMREFGWGAPGFDKDIMNIKKIVDTYDFDGDGNLNKAEFSLFQVHSVIKRRNQCGKHCLKNVIDHVLEPLFIYTDCDNDGFINADNMWEAFRNIFRNGTDKYDMYACQLPVELNKNYRTNSVNDLILKNAKIADGFINKEEFFTAILTGFWERQCEPLSYNNDFNSGTKKGLDKRWENAGKTDKECENILYFFK